MILEIWLKAKDKLRSILESRDYCISELYDYSIIQLFKYNTLSFLVIKH